MSKQCQFGVCIIHTTSHAFLSCHMLSLYIYCLNFQIVEKEMAVHKMVQSRPKKTVSEIMNSNWITLKPRYRSNAAK